MDLGLRNRIAIVTGSSQGICKAIAYGLAQEGAHVTLCARNRGKLIETAQDIASSTGTEVVSVRTDLRKKEDIRSMVVKTIEKFGRIDVLVNNTGGPPIKAFLGNGRSRLA